MNELSTLKPINFENGLNVIDSSLSDKIISFVDYRNITIKSCANVFVFLKDLNLPFEVTDQTFDHFMKLAESVKGGWYYHIRDYILMESRKTTEYLKQRLIYLTAHYDISIDISFEGGCNQYAVSYTFLQSDKTFMLKSYSDIMDCLDVLEVRVDEYLKDKHTNLLFQINVANNYSEDDLKDERA